MAVYKKCTCNGHLKHFCHVKIHPKSSLWVKMSRTDRQKQQSPSHFMYLPKQLKLCSRSVHPIHILINYHPKMLPITSNSANMIISGTSTYLHLYFLLLPLIPQDHPSLLSCSKKSRVFSRCGLNPQPSDQKSDALPLRHKRWLVITNVLYFPIHNNRDHHVNDELNGSKNTFDCMQHL